MDNASLQSSPPKIRFEFLDGVRGIAAIMVVLFHFQQFDYTNMVAAIISPMVSQGGWDALRGGWAAVDLFFVLSGFVIAHSYSEKIIGGMSFRGFARARITRLAPIYLLGMLLGLISAVWTLQAGDGGELKPLQLVTAVVFGLLVLPYVNRYSWPVGMTSVGRPLFPLNSPSWSMFFELFVNICFFIFLHRRRKMPGAVMAVVLAVLFAVAVWVNQSGNAGWRAEHFLFGFPRVLAGFFIGAWLYSLHTRVRSFPMIVPLVLVALLFAAAAFDHWFAHLLASLVFAPAAILTGARVELSAKIRPLFVELGELSYPLYILHLPLYQLTFQCIDFREVDRWVPPVIVGVIALAASVAAGRFDKRFRGWLAKRAAAKPVPAASAAS